MGDDVQIIERSDRARMVDALGRAFQEHPMVPPDPSGRRSRLMVLSLLDGFDGAPDARCLGIERDGEWACVAFVFADGSEPPWYRLPRMLWRMVRVVGLRKCVTYGRVMNEKHEGDDRRLQLMLLGTVPGFQGHGLGRVMMHHVFDLARERGYEAVTLEVAKDTPAFGFYESEGFFVEKEIAMEPMPLCFMKRTLD